MDNLLKSSLFVPEEAPPVSISHRYFQLLFTKTKRLILVLLQSATTHTPPIIKSEPDDMNSTTIQAPQGEGFDLDTAIASLVGPNPPNTSTLTLDSLKHFKKTTRNIGVRQKSRKDEKMAVTTDKEWKELNTLLWHFCCIDKITPELKYF